MNDETLLLRQVHPNFLPEGRLSSQAFVPFPKDEGQLSVYDGSRITAAAAHDDYTQLRGFASAGVWAVTKGESDAERVPGRPDPLEGFPQHAVLDFRELPRERWRATAKRLRNRECRHSSALTAGPATPTRGLREDVSRNGSPSDSGRPDRDR